MFFHQTQEQIPFHEMSPRERLAFLIYKSDFEPTEFGLSTLAIGISVQTIWEGWPPALTTDFIWAFPMLVVGIMQMAAWWFGRNHAGRVVRLVLSAIMTALWVYLVLTFGLGSPLQWLYLFPIYTSFWACYRLLLRIRASAWVKGQRG